MIADSTLTAVTFDMFRQNTFQPNGLQNKGFKTVTIPLDEPHNLWRVVRKGSKLLFAD